MTHPEEQEAGKGRLEIEATTTLRGRLAEVLVRQARINRCTPINLLADLVVKVVKGLDRAEPLKPSWPEKFDGALKLKLKPEVRAELESAAILRGVTDEQLASKLIETIVKDNLFAAVLED